MQVQIPYVCPHTRSIKCQHSQWFHQYMSHHKLLRSFVNLACWVRVVSFKENKLLTFLMIFFIVTWNFWLVKWSNFDKNRLVRSRFVSNMEEVRWCNVFTFLLLSFILLVLIISEDTICERWRVTCVIKRLTDQHLVVIEFWRYPFSSTQISVNCISLVSFRNTWRPAWC